MGFSPLPPHWFPPCAPFPPPHGCRRLYRSCSGIVPAAAVRATLNCCATSAVAASSWSASPSPFGPAHDSRRHKSMLGHRSHPPYITFYPVPHLSPTSTFAQYFPSVADLALTRSPLHGRSRLLALTRPPVRSRSRLPALPVGQRLSGTSSFASASAVQFTARSRAPHRPHRPRHPAATASRAPAARGRPRPIPGRDPLTPAM
jgi:hypothetical protein